jgi:hypothetical protein
MKEQTIFAVMFCEPHEGSYSLGHFSTIEVAHKHATNEVARVCEDQPIWKEDKTAWGNSFWADPDTNVSIEIWPITVRQEIPEKG